MVKTIGLIYDHDENWIAGSYYIENLIFALLTLPSEKPFLKIYTRTEADFQHLQIKTGYPSLVWVKLTDQNTLIDKAINKISYWLFRKHWITRGIDRNVDLLFPGSDSLYFDGIKRKLFWIPDFQEKHYPHFFQASELERRKAYEQKLIHAKWPVVFSSNNALNDFKQHFPKAENKTFVMPFAVTLPDLSGIKIDTVRSKFNLEGDYFICSNQFWAHKNHLIVLKALKQLKHSGISVNVAFTGKPYDRRNPDYFNTLKTYVEENDLKQNVFFLGFIERKEQLLLMKNSVAVIQPSLFEGWSTVVEDAKALNVPLIISDIPVHREQVGNDYELFFDKNDHLQLAEKIKEAHKKPVSLFKDMYDVHIRVFGDRFVSIMDEIAK